nr:hypothetical protein [Bacteroidota bacterium]
MQPSVTQPATAVTATCSGTNVACFGASTGSASVVAANGTSGYTYVWSNSNTNTGTSITGLAAGTYTVTVTDANGCTATCSYTVTQPATAVTATCSGTNVACFGASTGSASVVAANGTSGYTYVWSNSNTNTGTSITGLAAGTYTVTVTDANGCTATCGYTVTQPATAVTATCSGTNVACFGASTGSASVVAADGTSGYTYVWSNSNTNTGTSITGLAAGTYTVTVTDANGCTATCSYTVTQPASAVSAVCAVTQLITVLGNDGEITVTPGGGTPGYTYLWSDGQLTPTATGLVAGTYTVTVKDANNCTATCSSTLASFLPLSVVCSATNIPCNPGTNGTATVVASGGSTPYSYAWSSGPATSSITGLSAGTYTVIVTDNIGVTASCQATVTMPASPLSLSKSFSDSICNGSTRGVVFINPTGGTPPYTFLWTNGSTMPSITGLTAGTYTIVVTDANGLYKVKFHHHILAQLRQYY